VDDVDVADDVRTPVSEPSDAVAVRDDKLAVGLLVTSETSPPVLPHPKARAPLSIQLYVLQREEPGSELKCR
jgi:hypothetical protein